MKFLKCVLVANANKLATIPNHISFAIPEEIVFLDAFAFQDFIGIRVINVFRRTDAVRSTLTFSNKLKKYPKIKGTFHLQKCINARNGMKCTPNAATTHVKKRATISTILYANLLAIQAVFANMTMCGINMAIVYHLKIAVSIFD